MMSTGAVSCLEGTCGEESHPSPSPDAGAVLNLARRHILDRRRRRENFGSLAVLADGPSWDILLELAVAQLTGRAFYVGDACIISGVSQTASLRSIEALERAGLVRRFPDRLDGRRRRLTLSERGLNLVTTSLRAG